MMNFIQQTRLVKKAIKLIPVFIIIISFLPLSAELDDSNIRPISPLRGEVILLDKLTFKWLETENEAGSGDEPVPNYGIGKGLLSGQVEILDSLTANKQLAICGEIGYAYSVYWDGECILKNGNPASSKAEEQNGQFFLPIHLTSQQSAPGLHTIEIYFSNWNATSKKVYGAFYLGDYSTILKAVYQGQTIVYFLLGICFITFILNLSLFIGFDREPQYLMFAVMCILLLMLTFITYYWVFNSVDLSFSDKTATLLSTLQASFYVATVSFLGCHFSHLLTRGWKTLSLSTACLLIVFMLLKTKTAFILFLMICLMLILWAVYKSREGSLIALAAAVSIFSLNFIGVTESIHGNEQIVYSVILLIIFTNFSLVKRFSRNENLRKEAQLRSASLENELLKKSIQPHYLMNSLNSISVWLRKKPENAIDLIGALAEEFRIISSVSDLKLIPLDEELALCRAHLKIMSYRKGVEYTLETKGIDAALQIPPLVLHTLIENAITHGNNSSEGCHFQLEVFRSNEVVCYRFSNNCSIPDNNRTISEGTGYSYIRSRLKENYDNKWELVYGHTTEGWQVEIEILNPAGLL